MIYRVKFSLLLIVSLLASSAMAQDIHFSQIHATPLALNPAMTGVFEGSGRLIGNYRNQWKSVTADYKTFMFSADMNISGPSKNSILGIGGQVFNDVAGDLDFTTNGAFASLSVMQAFNDEGDHILSGGIQVGKVSNRFDPTKIRTHEQELGLLEDGVNQLSYLDFSAGMLWYMRFGGGEFIYLGGSLLHTNNPIVSFYSVEPGDQNELYRRYVIHGGANLNIGPNYTLVPSMILMAQGPNREATLGTFVRYANQDKKTSAPASLMFGAWFRAFQFASGRVDADAVIGAIRVDYSNLTFTFSYDINTSTLTHISAGRGGPEISIMYTFGTQSLDKATLDGDKPRRGRSKVKCPIW